MFYILVVKEAIGNTESDYSTLSAKTKDARMDGYLPIDCFVDEVRQTIDNGYEDDDGFESDEDYIKRAIDYLYNAPDKYVESLPKWYKQKHYLEEWLEKAAGYTSFKAYLDNRHVRVTIDRGNSSLGIMVENVRRLRKIAKQESYKEIHLQYYGDLDPSGDDMDRDLKQRIKSVNAKINIDEFRRTQFTKEVNHEIIYINGADYLQELVQDDPCLEELNKQLIEATREEDKKHPEDGRIINGRITIRDKIRIRKSEIISSYYPEDFPHLIAVTKGEDEEAEDYYSPVGIKKIYFERIAVTEEQVTRFNLPEMPEDQKTRDKLDRDNKTPRFIEKYNKLMAVEVDALDALHPDELRDLIQNSVDKYYDDKIYKKEILDKYGTKEYKREMKIKVLQRIRDLETKIEDDLAKDDE